MTLHRRLQRLEAEAHPAAPVLTMDERADRVLALRRLVESGRATELQRQVWARVEELLQRARDRREREEWGEAWGA